VPNAERDQIVTWLTFIIRFSLYLHVSSIWGCIWTVTCGTR